MLSKAEYDKYRGIVEGEETRSVLSSISPDEIGKLGGEMAGLYARLSGELADMKDAMLAQFMLLTSADTGGKAISVARAEKESEAIVNSSRQVSRRQIDYLMKALDKISFACSARIRSFNKEGHF
ncbi:hypothetical protein KA005_44530 [bacterium]|nr:hypothetical protein [bacterium]